MPSLGLDYQTLSKVNPKLVMTSVSSFGRNGRYSDYRATELVLYALCGMAYITGGYHREPVKHGYNQAQLTHRFNFDDYRKAFEVMRSGECGKIVLSWENH